MGEQKSDICIKREDLIRWLRLNCNSFTQFYSDGSRVSIDVCFPDIIVISQES